MRYIKHVRWTLPKQEQCTNLFPPGESCKYHERLQRAVDVQRRGMFFFTWGHQGRYFSELSKGEVGSPTPRRGEDVPAIGDGVSKGPAGGRPRSIVMKSFSMESGNPGFQSQLCLGL